MKIRAEMIRQHAPLWPREYQVDKVAELPNTVFASFMIQPLDRYDFIESSRVEPHQDDGTTHCLLLLSNNHTDGVLVQCGDDGHAMYTAFVAGARDVVQARLDRAADFIVSQGTRRTASGSWYVYCEELDEKFGVVIQEGNGLTFLTHEEADTSVLAEHLNRLTDAGCEDHAALLNARVTEIGPSLEVAEVVLTDVNPDELVRFNRALEAFEAAEQAMGPVM